MNRRLSGGADNSSLDLLLDTLCNVFGGIVLIACLLAILPRAKGTGLDPSTISETRLIERRIAAAEAEASRLREEIERLSADVDPGIVATRTRLGNLQQLHDRLAGYLEMRDSRELEDAEARAQIVTASPEALADRLEGLRAARTEADAVRQGQEEKIRILQDRLTDLSRKLENLKEGRTVMVRLPRERSND